MNGAAEKIELERKLSLVMGKPVNLHNPEVLKLTPDELKRMYHKRAKELHPDNAARTGRDPSYLTSRFKSLSESYSFVMEFWKEHNFSLVIRGYNNPQKEPFTASGSRTEGNAHTQKKYQPVHTPHSHRQPVKEERFGKRYYNGPMPCFQLRFAQFMYYTKKVDWNTFIKSLSWQWKVRPRLGEMAVKKGLLNYQDILIILKNKMPDELFGKAAVRLGFLQQKDLSVLLGHQHLMNKPIGQFFVEQGCLQNHEVEEYIAKMRRYNLRIRTENN